MEQHPVPRNISGFQFHLIGDMTLRQFLYLAGGALSAYLIYRLTPFPVIIKFSFAGAVGFVGFALAFLPIQERPLDRWIIAFIKSIYAPTQYLWHKECVPPEILTRSGSTHISILPPNHARAHQDAKTKLHAYLNNLPVTPHQTLNTAEKHYIDSTIALFNNTSLPPTIVIPSITQPKEPTPPVVPIVPQPIQQKTPAVALIPKIEPVVKPPPVRQPAADYTKLQTQLNQLSWEKQALAEELKKLKQELNQTDTRSVIKPTPATETKKPTIKTFTPQQAVDEVGMPKLPQAPNLVIGVVKDAQKRLIPNLIITIKDVKGVPLRALKTNKLGQFAVATPLPNGTYLLEIEDPMKRYVFDIAELTLSGKIFLPIEIIAKGEKEVLREKLTKELFGSANI